MSKSLYLGGVCFVGACILGALFCLTMVWLGHIGLPSDRQTSIRGLVEMVQVGLIFVAVWTAAYWLARRKGPKPGL
jgi:hypothetical protein